MVRAIARQDLLAAGRLARQLDGVLVGLGAAVGEEEDVDVAGRDLGQLLAQPGARLGGHERIGVGQLLGLRLDGVDDALVAVADVDAHQLRVEVEVALAVGRVEVDAFGALDRDGVDRALRRPLVQRVLAARGRRSRPPSSSLVRLKFPWREFTRARHPKRALTAGQTVAVEAHTAGQRAVGPPGLGRKCRVASRSIGDRRRARRSWGFGGNSGCRSSDAGRHAG